MFQAICLQPLNLFLYTWRLLQTLEKEEKFKFLKVFYRWFAALTILLIPLGFYGIFVTYVIEQGRFNEYLVKGEF
jgi:hypothetical protein